VQAVTDWTETRIAQAAAHLGLEAEAVETDYVGIRPFLSRCAPAILHLPDGRFLPILARRGGTLQILVANLDTLPLPLASLVAILRHPLQEDLSGQIDGLLEGLSIQGKRQAKMREALWEELLAGRRLRVGWLVRPAGNAALSWQAKDFRVRGLLACWPSCLSPTAWAFCYGYWRGGC
jgi:ATP-binding cassette subfamily B protein